MQTVEKFIPITQAKSKLLDMVRSIHDRDDTFAITKNGVPEAVLISMSKFEGLLETIEVLADQNAMVALSTLTRLFDVIYGQVYPDCCRQCIEVTSGNQKAAQSSDQGDICGTLFRQRTVYGCASTQGDRRVGST